MRWVAHYYPNTQDGAGDEVGDRPGRAVLGFHRSKMADRNEISSATAEFPPRMLRWY